MPRFTGQNKKRIDPRYFLNEITEESGATEVSPDEAKSAEAADVWMDSDLESLRAALPGKEILDPMDPRSMKVGRSNPEALMPMYTVEEGGSRVVYFKTFGTHKYFKISTSRFDETTDRDKETFNSKGYDKKTGAYGPTGAEEYSTASARDKKVKGQKGLKEYKEEWKKFLHESYRQHQGGLYGTGDSALTAQETGLSPDEQYIVLAKLNEKIHELGMDYIIDGESFPGIEDDLSGLAQDVNNPNEYEHALKQYFNDRSAEFTGAPGFGDSLFGG